MIVRPPEFLEDIRERELEMQAAEARLHSLDYQLCPHCDHPVGRDFLRCPHCLRKLRDTVRDLREAARPRLDDLPVLRGARSPGSRRSAARGAAPAARTPASRRAEATGYEDAAIGEAFDAGTEPAIEAGYGDGPQAAYDEALESEAPPSTQH